LLSEIADEVEIDSHGLDFAEEVETRLKQLKGDSSEAATTKPDEVQPQRFLQNLSAEKVDQVNSMIRRTLNG
jgi:hypothetical protein